MFTGLAKKSMIFSVTFTNNFDYFPHMNYECSLEWAAFFNEQCLRFTPVTGAVIPPYTPLSLTFPHTASLQKLQGPNI